MENKRAKKLFKSVGSLIGAFAVSTFAAVAVSALPSSYSSAAEGYITPVKFQGVHGTCWSFSYNSATETSIIKEHPELFSAESLDLSENMTAYFSFYPTLYGHIGLSADKYYYYGDYLQDGGNPDIVINNFAINWYGPYYENADYPYNDSGVPSIAYQNWTEREYLNTIRSSMAHLTDSYYVNMSDSDAINKVKQLIYDYGSVTTNYYHEGMYLYNMYYYCPVNYATNHAATIVGWDDNISAALFGDNPPGNGAWLVKNSWGTDFGDQGFFWISYYDKSLVDFLTADYAIEGDKDYYDNLFSYDGNTIGYRTYNGSGEIYTANIFKSDKSQTLEAISYYSDQSGTTYYAYVYLNPAYDNPTSGTLVATLPAYTYSTTGYKTFKLDKPISLKAGDTFAVVLKAVNKTEVARARFEWAGNMYITGDSLSYAIGIEPGQSFITKNPQSYWFDMYNDREITGNCCIKAYTNDASKTKAPTGLSANETSDNSVKITWDNISDAAGYRVEILRDGKWVEVLDITDKTKSYANLKNMTRGMDYFVRITGYKSANPGKIYGKSSIISTSVGGLAVKNLKAANISSTSCVLSWDKAAGADGYCLEWNKNGKWTKLGYFGSDANSYTVKKLTSGKKYYFRVYPYKQQGKIVVNGKRSAVKAVTTRPQAMTGVACGGKSSDVVRIKWNKNSSVTGYIIEQYKSGKWVRIAKIQRNTVTLHRVTGLSASTEYKFRVQGYKEIGSGAVKTGYKTVTVTTNPKNVTGLKLKTRSSKMVTLTWNVNNSATGYIIERYKGGKWVRIAKLTSNKTNTYKLSGLTPSSKYSLRVQAYKNIPGGAVRSEYVKITATTNPISCEDFKMTARSSQTVKLGWKANSSATGYIIEQYKGGKWVRVAKLTNSKTTSYKVTGLAASSNYQFRIQAYKDFSQGSLKSGYKTITVYTQPKTVTGLTVTKINSNTIRLSWNKNTTATGYIIEAYQDGKWTRIAKLTDNSKISCKISGLDKNTTHKFRIQAYKEIGKSTAKSAYSMITVKT